MKIILAAALILAAFAQQPTPAKVVFVCEHGAAKSIIAAAEFERLAKQQGLAVQVVSRGTTPDAEIGAAVKQGLKKDGIDLGAAKPVKISAKDLEGATRVVTFGPDLTPWLPKGAKALDWSATPSPGQDFGVAKDYIMRQLEALAADMKKSERAAK